MVSEELGVVDAVEINFAIQHFNNLSRAMKMLIYQAVQPDVKGHVYAAAGFAVLEPLTLINNRLKLTAHVNASLKSKFPNYIVGPHPLKAYLMAKYFRENLRLVDEEITIESIDINAIG